MPTATPTKYHGPTTVPTAVPTNEPTIQALARCSLQVVRTSNKSALKVFVSNEIELLGFSFGVRTQAGEGATVTQAEGGLAKMADFHVDVLRGSTVKGSGTYSNPIPTGHQHLLTVIHVEDAYHDRVFIHDERLCIHDARLLDKFGRSIDFGSVCEEDKPVIGGGHGKGDALTPCEHRCCATVLPQFPNLATVLSVKLPFEDGKQDCGDTLDALGLSKDPCTYDMANAGPKFGGAAHAFCHCFMECSAQVGAPAPVPAAVEYLVKDSEKCFGWKPTRDGLLKIDTYRLCHGNCTLPRRIKVKSVSGFTAHFRWLSFSS
jgi:hypothetical protein